MASISQDSVGTLAAFRWHLVQSEKTDISAALTSATEHHPSVPRPVHFSCLFKRMLSTLKLFIVTKDFIVSDAVRVLDA